MNDIIQVQVVFTEQTQYGDFRDALYFSLEEYATLTQADIDAKKQERLDSFIYNIENRQPVVEEIIEE